MLRTSEQSEIITQTLRKFEVVNVTWRLNNLEAIRQKKRKQLRPDYRKQLVYLLGRHRSRCAVVPRVTADSRVRDARQFRDGTQAYILLSAPEYLFLQNVAATSHDLIALSRHLSRHG